MKIAMFTNTYTPHVGGVANSVKQFTEEYRQKGHHVLVIAPEFENQPQDERNTLRVPAIQNFNGSDFSVSMPAPGRVSNRLDAFEPDIVHSHHPFLLGATAVRMANRLEIPLVFTHHTFYEQYTHYVPVDTPRLKKFVIELTAGYADLCDAVIAPSESVEDRLRQDDVSAPIHIIPTGVYCDEYKEGDRASFREAHGIPQEAFVIGHLGRLAPEKNLDFLVQAVIPFLQQSTNYHFVAVGDGPSLPTLQETLQEAGLGQQAHFTGPLKGQEKIDAYHGMDVFAFSSKSETQGMVLMEALAAGVPIVALAASGVREVVRDGQNGVLIHSEEVEEWVNAFEWMAKQHAEGDRAINQNALASAQEFSMSRCADRALALYQSLMKNRVKRKNVEMSVFDTTLNKIRTEWELLKNISDGFSAAFKEENENSR